MDPNRPADFLNLKTFDPSSKLPGAPPNFGQPVVPHIFTVAGQQGLAGRAYLNADEAILHDPQNAERMRADCRITECLEARQRAVALLPWHIESENPDDKSCSQLIADMTRIINRTPRFTEMRRYLSEATWYGRAASALQYASVDMGNNRAICVKRWEPRHGDKLVFRYDDGTGMYDPDQVGIRIGTGGWNLDTLSEKRRTGQIDYTSQGMVYWFNKYERKTVIVHKHMVEDGPFDQLYHQGRIHGVGIRTRIYWTWYQAVECMQRALEYLDRSAFGVELWRFPANNAQGEAAARKAAESQVGGGRSVILVPVVPGENASMYGVEHIEPGLQGVDTLLSTIKDFYHSTMKRYILGQTLTSEAEATGMGSGVADAHLATFADIVEYDARNLEETLTEDFLRHVQLWNFPQSSGTFLRFKIDNHSDDVDSKLKGYKAAWDMGAKLKASDVMDALGLSLPQPNEPALFNPQVAGGIEQMEQAQQQQPTPAHAYTADVLKQNLMQAVAGAQQQEQNSIPEVSHG
jgi:hypothetical protein